MKTVSSAAASICVLIGLALAGCASPSRSPSIDVAAARPAGDNQEVMRVNGMSCPLCAHNIEQQVGRVPGVEKVEIDLGSGRVIVSTSKTNKPDRAELAAAIDRSGFSFMGFVPADPSNATLVCRVCSCTDCACATADARCAANCNCKAS